MLLRYEIKKDVKNAQYMCHCMQKVFQVKKCVAPPEENLLRRLLLSNFRMFTCPRNQPEQAF